MLLSWLLIWIFSRLWLVSSLLGLETIIVFFFQDVKEAMKLNNKNMGKRYIEGSFISLLHLSRYQGGACAGIYLFMNNSDTLL